LFYNNTYLVLDDAGRARYVLNQILFCYISHVQNIRTLAEKIYFWSGSFLFFRRLPFGYFVDKCE
jgi:hypothetical protein